MKAEMVREAGEGRRAGWGVRVLEVLRELPKLVSEFLEVPSVGGRACSLLMCPPGMKGEGCVHVCACDCVCVCIEERWDDWSEY